MSSRGEPLTLSVLLMRPDGTRISQVSVPVKLEGIIDTRLSRIKAALQPAALLAAVKLLEVALGDGSIGHEILVTLNGDADDIAAAVARRIDG